MARFRVHKGTRSANATCLCHTCTHATIARGAAESEEIIDCGLFDKQLPFKVIECSSYVNKAQVRLSDMYDVAWILEPSKKQKGDFGFKPFKQWKQDNPHTQVVPGGVYED